MDTIKRKSLLYKTDVEYGDYTINHVQGCAHGCKYPCYAMQMAKRFGKIKTYEEWCEPKLAENALEILDKDKKPRDTISSVYGGNFKIGSKWPEGPYYLHYLRLNSYPLAGVVDSLRYVLQLSTMVQQPGLLKTMKFYDSEKDAVMKEQVYTEGDTIRFKDFTLQMAQHSSSSWKEIGSDIDWFVPCTSLNFLNNSTNSYSCDDDEDEQEISSDNLIAKKISENSDKIELIAQSVADPSMRDTLMISIIAKAD